MFIEAIANIAEIQVGYQAQKGIEERFDGSHGLIQSRDFDRDHSLNAKSLISFNPDRNPELYSVNKGNILFQARGTEHFSYHIDLDLINTIASNSFYILRISDKNILPAYVSWWLNQSPAQQYFYTNAGSSMMSFISKTTLSNLKIQIPKISIQQKIVEIVKLLKQEYFLTNKLVHKRSRLIQAVCLNSIKD